MLSLGKYRSLFFFKNYHEKTCHRKKCLLYEYLWRHCACWRVGWGGGWATLLFCKCSFPSHFKRRHFVFPSMLCTSSKIWEMVRAVMVLMIVFCILWWYHKWTLAIENNDQCESHRQRRRYKVWRLFKKTAEAVILLLDTFHGIWSSFI